MAQTGLRQNPIKGNLFFQIKAMEIITDSAVGLDKRADSVKNG